VLHKFHTTAVSGDGVFKFKLAAFHAGDNAFKIGEGRLEFHVGDGGLIHVIGLQGNTRKYSIKGLQVKSWGE